VSIPPQQHEVAGFLRCLCGVAPKETHISAVFIGHDTVWKLKKAVHLPFVDFTTVEARRHFLQRELDLNQPAAPGIYRDVVAVVRCPDGMLALNKEPRDVVPIDWVLRMAPVPEHDFLDIMAARGDLTPKGTPPGLGSRWLSERIGSLRGDGGGGDDREGSAGVFC